MYSVFSQSIMQTWKRDHPHNKSKDVPTTSMTPYDIIQQYSNKKCTMYGTMLYPCVMWCHRISTLDYLAEEATKVLWTNKDLQKLAVWIENNIVLKVTTDYHKTMLVKIRIAVDMLNKIENSGQISKELSLFYFDNIVSNCNDLWYDVIFDGDNELPF